MEKVFVLDLGSTHIKGYLYTEKGECLFEGKLPFPKDRSPKGAKTILKRSIQLIQEGVSQSVSSSFFLAITSQRGTALLFDPQTGNPKTPLFSWRHFDFLSHAKKLNRQLFTKKLQQFAQTLLFFFPSSSKLRLLSRFQFSPSMASVALHFWRLQGAPKHWRFGCLDSWLLFHLTQGKVHATDPSMASATGLFHPETGWTSPLIHLLKIPREWLPQVFPSASRFGEAKIAKKSFAIQSLLADQQASLWTVTGFGKHKQRLGITLGTGMFYHLGLSRFHVPKKFFFPMAWCEKEKRLFFLEAFTGSGGSVLHWLKQTGFLSTYEEFDQKVSPPSPSLPKAFFWPPFPPYPVARTPLPGWYLTSSATPLDLLSSVADWFGFFSHLIYRTLSQEGFFFEECWIDGGGKNATISQRIAEALQCPVIWPNVSNSTAYGAASLCLPLPPVEKKRVFRPVLSSKERNQWLQQGLLFFEKAKVSPFFPGSQAL